MNRSDFVMQIEVSDNPEAVSCEFATAYPIGRDRVITAAHVLKSSFKTPYIEAVFTDPEHPGSFLSSKCEKVVWDGQKHEVCGGPVDVVVLSCKLPPHFPGVISLSRNAPSGPVQAHALGYPQITRKRQRQTLLDAFGTVASFPTGQPEFEMHCNDRLNDRKKWKGVSGGPVFVEDDLAGIIREYKGTHNNDHFGVIAICRLLENQLFRNAIGFDDRDEAYRRTIETSIEARLRALSSFPVEDGSASRPPIQWLLKKLGLPLEEAGSSETERAASALVQPNKEGLLPLLIGMHEKLCHLHRKEDAPVLGAVIDMITPLQIPPDLWQKIREQKTEGRTVICGGAAGIVTAETVAARIDGLEEPGPVKLSRKTDGDLTSPHSMLPKTYHPVKRFLSNPGSARAVREGTLHARARCDDPSTRPHGGSVARRVRSAQRDARRPLPVCAGDDAAKTGR